MTKITTVEITDSSRRTKHLFELTRKGREILQSGKTFNEYLAEEKEKVKRDEQYKMLQMKDMETKVNVLNTEQMNFWVSQRERNKQLTLMGIISILISMFALAKSFGFFD